MFKILLSLLLNRAKLSEWQLQVGAYLLKKGCGFHVGQIIDEKKIGYKLYRVKVITNLFYNFHKNEVTHTTERKVLHSK